MSANNYVAKAIFTTAPTLDVWAMTFTRGLIAFTMKMLQLNINAKKELWDDIDMPSLPSLIFRCFQGGASLVIAFMSIKYFPVSTVGIVCSLAPPITMVLACVFLKEFSDLKEIIQMTLIVMAIMAVILGAEGEQKDTMSTNAYAFIALIC